METANQNLFPILQDNFNWINEHGDEFLKKMKAFYASLPDDNQMKAKVIRQLQSIEIIPEASKDFKITKTHQTITSYFMSQVFNGYQNSIVYYIDDIIPTFNSLVKDSTIESIYKLKLSDEQKFKMELFLRSSRLISISEQAHAYVLNSIFNYIHDIYFRSLSKAQSNRSSEITKNDSSKLSETHEEQFQLLVESILRRYNQCFDYMMILTLAGDSLSMDLLENIEEMDVEIFKYVYDFVYLNEKPSKKNKEVLNMLKREEIIEFLHLVKPM